MTTYNLITMFGDQVSGIEPIVCDVQQDAVAYSCGVLTERTKVHAEMYANLGVHWTVEGERFWATPLSLLGGKSAPGNWFYPVVT